MRIGIHEAKTHLSRLIPAALAGEEIIITRSGKPLVKLVPVKNSGKPRRLGIYKDKIRIHGDLCAPLPEEIVNDFWPDES